MTTYTQPKHTLPLYECVLCKDEYMGYGNNAAPVAEGKCCDNCNFTQVISARLERERNFTRMLVSLEALGVVVEEDDELKATLYKNRYINEDQALIKFQAICRGWIVRNEEEPLCECCFEAPSQGLSCDQCANPCCAECIDSHPLGCGSICSECIEEGEECQVGCANRWHIDDPRQCEICHEYGCEDCVEWNEENNDFICSECLEDANEEEEEQQG